MGRAPEGALIRCCPNCHEELRVTQGPDPGISLTGRTLKAEDPGLEAGEEKGPLVQLLDHLTQAEMIAREAMVSCAIEMDPPYGVEKDTVPAEGRAVNETKPAFNLPAEMVVRLRIKVEVDGINV